MIEGYLDSNNRQMLQGVQHITNHKANLCTADGDSSLAEEVNLFFASFEAVTRNRHSSFTLTVEEQEVRRTLRAVNPKKAAGPDSISGWVLNTSAEQLAGIFTRIFNQSLSQP